VNAARGHLRSRAAAALLDRQSVGLAAVRVRDTTSGYGWISIALHWLAAAIVLTMWTVGIMSQVASEADAPGLVHLHTTIGMTAYELLWARIVWRFKVGHPGPLPRQSAFLFPVAKYFHFLLLVAIGVMLISGPLMVWSDGDANFDGTVNIFDINLVSSNWSTTGPTGAYPWVESKL
jgi:cytochrome b561